MPSLAGTRVPGPQVKPPTPRHTTAAAVAADVPAFICTTQSGVVTCTDEAGSPVQGEQLKQLQALLKPIADAPALADEPVNAKVSGQQPCQLFFSSLMHPNIERVLDGLVFPCISGL